MHLTLHLTRSCNMRCDYCYAPPRPDPGMSDQVAQRALAFGARLNPKSCGIVFFGGEPLLHLDLIKRTMAQARRLEQQGGPHFFFKLTTNGLLVDAEFIDFAVANDLLVAMSFDGVAAAHDSHRRLADGSRTFATLLPRLRLLLGAKPYSTVICIVNPDTARYLAESIEFLLNEGCRYLIVSLNHDAEWSNKDFVELAKQYERLGKLYVEWTRAGRKFYLSPFEVKLSSHIEGNNYHKDRCELAARQISVDPDGALYPCVQFTRAGASSDWCIGNVDDGIDEAARTRIHTASEVDKTFCARCAIAKRCNNTCGCLNWQTTGSINQISPVLCKNEQLLVAAADKVGKILYRERNPHFLHKHYNHAYPFLSLLEDKQAEKDGRVSHK